MRKRYIDDEEQGTGFGYSRYIQPNTLEEQVGVLRLLFPHLVEPDYALGSMSLPVDAEGCVAIPRWDRISPTYRGAVEMGLDLVRRDRQDRLEHLADASSRLTHVRQTAESVEAYEIISHDQGGADILIIPAQFGFRHRGRSVHRVSESRYPGEFGLGFFGICMMLLTHPDRLICRDDLHVDCFGDHVDSFLGLRATRIPQFRAEDGWLTLGEVHFCNAYERSSSPTGFIWPK